MNRGFTQIVLMDNANSFCIDTIKRLIYEAHCSKTFSARQNFASKQSVLRWTCDGLQYTLPVKLPAVNGGVFCGISLKTSLESTTYNLHT